MSGDGTVERSAVEGITVGVLGGGQLGRMLALAGYPLGCRFRFLDPSMDAPAGRVGELVVGRYDDGATLDRFADGLDVATFEFENVPAGVVERLGRRVAVLPGARALAFGQDRLREKEGFQSLGIPTAPFAPVDDAAGLRRAVEEIGLPAVLKTRRLGYDGKGQRVLRERSDLEGAWESLGSVPCILEGWVSFDRELSIVLARGSDGSTAAYPLTQNRHGEGILRESIAPAPGVTEAQQARARDHAERLAASLDYVGVLAIELFAVGEELVANEMAPRVHNSGHWTLDGAETSQFENHLRAVLGLPLGATDARGAVGMLNVLGRAPARGAVLRVPGAHLHLYDKAPRPGRKIGHVTVVAPTAEQLDERLAALRPLLAG